MDWIDGRWPNDKDLDGLRRDVYNDAKIKEIAALAELAKRNVAPNTIEGRRVKLFTEQFVGELLKRLGLN